MIARAHHDYPELPVRRLCLLLGVARSWYYERPNAPTKTERDVAPRNAIERVVLAFPGYGYRRVTKALAREGWEVNHKRVLRVMRQESLLCQLQRRFVATTDSGHALRTYPNLLVDRVLTGPDQVWVADITYIRLPTAFAYLACILDAWSRYRVGWHLSRAIDTQLTLAPRLRAPGAAASPRSDPPFGPGRSVRQHGLRRAAGGGGSEDQHGGRGESVRQRPGRELLQDAEVRGGVPAAVRDVRRSRASYRPLHRRRLQHEAAALRLGLCVAERVRSCLALRDGTLPAWGTMRCQAFRAG